MKKRLHLSASYMKDFQCLGSTCDDTCCSGWYVSIDKKTFVKYKQISDKKMKRKLNSVIKRNKLKTSFSDYATFRLTPSGFCPLLNKDKLCSIQLALGESYLSGTCASYPRQYAQLYSTYELTGALSCPEMARLVLLQPEGISIESFDGSIGNNPLLDKYYANDLMSRSTFFAVRDFVCTLLRNRTAGIDERLLMVGQFLLDLEQIVEREQYEQIGATIHNYMTDMEGGALRARVADLPVACDAQLLVLRSLIDDYVQLNNSNARYMECYDQVCQGLPTIDSYEQAYAEWYGPYMQAHPYILENYLVNYVISRLFPFARTAPAHSIFDEYIIFLLHYALLKMHLIGLSSFHRGLTGDLVVKLVQSFSRTFEHDYTFFERTLEALKERVSCDLPTLSVLLKHT